MRLRCASLVHAVATKAPVQKKQRGREDLLAQIPLVDVTSAWGGLNNGAVHQAIPPPAPERAAVMAARRKHKGIGPPPHLRIAGIVGLCKLRKRVKIDRGHAIAGAVGKVEFQLTDARRQQIVGKFMHHPPPAAGKAKGLRAARGQVAPVARRGRPGPPVQRRQCQMHVDRRPRLAGCIFRDLIAHLRIDGPPTAARPRRDPRSIMDRQWPLCGRHVVIGMQPRALHQRKHLLAMPIGADRGRHIPARRQMLERTMGEHLCQVSRPIAGHKPGAIANHKSRARQLKTAAQGKGHIVTEAIQNGINPGRFAPGKRRARYPPVPLPIWRRDRKHPERDFDWRNARLILPDSWMWLALRDALVSRYGVGHERLALHRRHVSLLVPEGQTRIHPVAQPVSGRGPTRRAAPQQLHAEPPPARNQIINAARNPQILKQKRARGCPALFCNTLKRGNATGLSTVGVIRSGQPKRCSRKDLPQILQHRLAVACRGTGKRLGQGLMRAARKLGGQPPQDQFIGLSGAAHFYRHPKPRPAKPRHGARHSPKRKGLCRDQNHGGRQSCIRAWRQVPAGDRPLKPRTTAIYRRPDRAPLQDGTGLDIRNRAQPVQNRVGLPQGTCIPVHIVGQLVEISLCDS